MSKRSWIRAALGALTLGLALAAVAVAVGTDRGPRFAREDKVTDLERASTRADGAKVIRDRVGGRGTIRDKHVVFEDVVAPGDSPESSSARAASRPRW